MKVRVHTTPKVREHRRAGLDFTREATEIDVDAETLARLEADGLLVVDRIEATVNDGLDAMTLAQLRNAALEGGLDSKGLKKPELIAAIREAAARG